MRGSGWPQDRVSSQRPRSRTERGPVGLLIAESRMRWREVGRPAASLTNVVLRRVSVGGADRPAEAGELAADRDRDDRATLAALGVEALPGAVEPALRWPADRGHRLRLSALTAREFAPDPGRPAVVPGRLDQQPAGVLPAGLRDRAEPPLVAGGVLRRHHPEVAHQLPGATEAIEV